MSDFYLTQLIFVWVCDHVSQLDGTLCQCMVRVTSFAFAKDKLYLEVGGYRCILSVLSSNIEGYMHVLCNGDNLRGYYRCIHNEPVPRIYPWESDTLNHVGNA